MKVRIAVHDAVVTSGHGLMFVFHSKEIKEWLLDSKHEFEDVIDERILVHQFIVDVEIAMAIKLRYGDRVEMNLRSLHTTDERDLPLTNTATDRLL